MTPSRGLINKKGASVMDAPFPLGPEAHYVFPTIALV
jgi:hypothetical protein